MKNKWFVFFGILLAIGFVFGGCASISDYTANILDVPPESPEEKTKFEGAWWERTSGSVFRYSFKGNTFIRQAQNFGGSSTWQKGIFTYTDSEITFYILAGYACQSISDTEWFESKNLYKDGQTVTKEAFKYSFVSDSLTMGKLKYDKGGMGVYLPEEYVFLLNSNNFINPDPYAFTITEVDDEKAHYISMFIYGEGYSPVEQKWDGEIKISFKQKIRSGGRMETEIEGYFTKEFVPGIYAFSVYTPEYDSFMPANLPEIPVGNTRIVIIRTEIGFREKRLYDYIDILTAKKK